MPNVPLPHGEHDAAPPGGGAKNPSAHGVVLTAPNGHAEPGGHETGAPDAQKLPAGHGTHASARTRFDAVSATTSVPLGPTATSRGALNVAAVPHPSRKGAAAALPAIVVTAPDGSSARTRLLPASAIKIVPKESTATPAGKASVAAGPSAKGAAAPVPASVATAPCGETARMRCPCVSPTMTVPFAPSATPDG